ncbi:MAG: hypothetical protein HY063_05215 [Bacteroidetes bacterium]|nr:hypothetical protein [Bacteroidota bacterium]
MSNHSILEAVEKQISELEDKLHKEIQKPNASNILTDEMKVWLHALHQKRREIISRTNEPNNKQS